MEGSKNRVAIIDMGTNTFHLIIADIELPGSFCIVENNIIPVKIGENGISESRINEEAQKRGIEALKEFKRTINRLQVDLLEVYATSAIRSATNSREFLERIQKQTGFLPAVIDGQKEAEFIYFGVLAYMDLPDKPNLIMDIGGGSIEFIIADKNKIHWSRSFEIGAQRLKDRFHTSDPITDKQLQKLESFLNNKLVSLTEILKKFKPDTLIGVSGTFDTLNDLFEIRFRNEISTHPGDDSFSIEAFEPIRKELTGKSLEERINTPGMAAFRAGMIVVALALINWVLKQNEFKKLRISKFSLKEGILYSMVNKQP